jgi:uncharacterized protein (UPF0332 family)
MGIAEDLLTLAGRLANPAPKEPEQASLRRSVSTAYYALFHFLVREAVQGWNGTDAMRAGLERRFEHSKMKSVSQAVAQDKWPGWSTPSLTVPSELRYVARIFVLLQEARHLADYDNAKEWTTIEAREKVAEVQKAFQNWVKIRTDPAANEYLLSLLIGNKRE